MNVLLLCDKTAPNLFPLAGELPVALLPVAGKNLVEFHLELLCGRLKPETVSLYGGAYGSLLQAYLGDGSRWGTRLEYPTSLPSGGGMPLLVVPCDRLSGFDLGEFLHRVFEQPSQSSVAMVDGMAAAYWVATMEDWREVLSGALDLHGIRQLSCAGAVRPIRTLSEFHQANLDLLGGSFQGLLLDLDNSDEKLQLGGRAWVSNSVNLHGKAYVGDGSKIGNEVTLSGHCVIAPHVLVDNNATLENCVILPNSYVGRWVSLRNAVVYGTRVWRLDSDTLVRVEQRFLLRQLPDAANVGGWLSRWLGRPWFLAKNPAWRANRTV